MRYVSFISVIGGCMLAFACDRSDLIDQPIIKGDGSEMIEFLRVKKTDNGLTFAEFRFTNKTGRPFEYFGDTKNAPDALVEQETTEGWKPCQSGLCGTTGAKPDYYTLAPGRSITFSARWDVYSRYPIKRLGIRLYSDKNDRKKNEVTWSGPIRERD